MMKASIWLDIPGESVTTFHLFIRIFHLLIIIIIIIIIMIMQNTCQPTLYHSSTIFIVFTPDSELYCPGNRL